MCYYSDLHRDNFPVDSNGQLWVVDFQQAGVLPSSFMTFALHSSRQRRLPLPIRKTIPVPETSNLKLISYVSYILQISWNMCESGENHLCLINAAFRSLISLVTDTPGESIS